ncbi:YeeE/YedE family protein [Desulforhopalus vacuolatus]|uniref:DUF6691 family protein n=1 Tax=Desulforhopalus vacuolatus TaxID=40414 RepID=UPI001962A75C|nr:DUF6691 family protein [Desulforhopalus vacuolatus]MBM9519731.1 YeeE/YedE family protein [Desulforhopalus vacuolatus]
MQIALAILLGLFFGFTLQKVGAANPVKIIDMLRFRDLHLMKAILFGIGFAMIGLFVLLHFEVLNVASHLSVKSAYTGVIVGGVLLGAGWGMAGFCPGTGLVGLGAGRRDAWVFLIGGLLGAFLYTLIYGWIKGSFLFTTIGGGKSTLAVTGNKAFPALFPDIPGYILGCGIGAGFILVSLLLPVLKKRRVQTGVEESVPQDTTKETPAG